MNTRLLLLPVSLAALFVTSCSRPAAPASSAYLNAHVGQECVVQFRRDALGGAAPLPVSPLSSSVNGAEVVQLGTLRAVEAHGLVLGQGEGPGSATFWIPNAVVLSVRFTEKAQAK